MVIRNELRRAGPRGGGAERAPGAPGVLLIGNFLSATAGNRGVCEELAERLRGAGWPLLTTSAQPGRARRLFDMLASVWRWRDEYAVAHVDVYSGRAFVWAEAVGGALRRARKPYVLTLHGGNLPAFARRRPRRVRRLLQSAAAVTTPSRYLFDAMEGYRDGLQLLPNALDLEAYPFLPRRRPAARLIWLRAFHTLYNPALAPRVVALLAADHPEVELIMVGPCKGDGSLRHTQQVACQLGVADRVSFPGAVPKGAVAAQLNAGDIFLNTTNVDNTPVSVLEAMACGLCIVSTAVGGIPHLLKHEESALLVPPDDEAAMAAAVRRLLSEPRLAARLSQKARREAEKFDWSAILPRWEATLAAAAKGGER